MKQQEGDEILIPTPLNSLVYLAFNSRLVEPIFIGLYTASLIFQRLD